MVADSRLSRGDNENFGNDWPVALRQSVFGLRAAARGKVTVAAFGPCITFTIFVSVNSFPKISRRPQYTDRRFKLNAFTL